MTSLIRSGRDALVFRTVAGFAAFVACLFFAIPVQADEIEPEPEPIAEPAPIAEPEPKPALQAGAQSTAEYDRNGPYLMLGGGYSFEYFRDVDPLNVDDSPNLIVHAGWRIHPHAAVDVGFEWNQGFDTNLEGIDVELETYLTTVGMKIYALKGRIQPFLHPSIGVMVASFKAGGLGSESKTTPALRAGGGIDVYVTENLFVSFSAYYVLALRSEVDDIQYAPISAAVGWRF